jgi:protein-tyrosine-phosphatase
MPIAARYPSRASTMKPLAREELAGRPANHRSVSCMKECGVDLSVHVSRWVGDLDLDQYQWIVCVGHDEADQVRSLLGADKTRVIVANEHQGGIPDPYELGLAGYRDCLALLDEVMPHVARRIRQAQSANTDGH